MEYKQIILAGIVWSWSFFVLKMVGSNCSIYGCSNSRNKTMELRISWIPTKDNECRKKWGNDLVHTIARKRAIGNQLREQIAESSLYICELHYREDQINCCQVVILTKCFIFNSDNHYCYNHSQNFAGKVQFHFFSNFLLILAKFSFWEDDWALDYNSMKF